MGFRSKSKVVSYGKLPYIARGCRASFHTRHLGLMNLPEAADRFWWPLEGLGTATISRVGLLALPPAFVQDIMTSDNRWWEMMGQLSVFPIALIIGVAPTFQGQGFGGKLLRALAVYTAYAHDAT